MIESNAGGRPRHAALTNDTRQDGVYLAEFLLPQSYVVHDLRRRTSLFDTQRIDHPTEDSQEEDSRFFLWHQGDTTDTSSLINVTQKMRPDEIYNPAAQSHVALSFEEPEFTANFDAVGTLRVLQAVRSVGMSKEVRFYQASTSELYGLIRKTPKYEMTPFCFRSLYAVTKLYAHRITMNYREAYEMSA